MNTISKGVSVTLCTYNGKTKLDKTLEHLSTQKVNVPLEIILVDNASTDDTKEFSDDFWRENGNAAIEYRSFVQPIPGKSYAQDLAYAEAKYEYIIVCDDDNWLDETYCQTAFEVMEGNKEIGALGGQSTGAFETEKPEWFDQVAKTYAIGKQWEESGEILHGQGVLFGAGMVIRKSHWLDLKRRGFEHQLSCRKGNKLTSGGDVEYCYALWLLGYKIWYDERLRFTHYMLKERLTIDYFHRIKKGMAESQISIRAYRDILQGRSVNWVIFKLLILKTLTMGLIQNTRRVLAGDYKEKAEGQAYFTYLSQLFTDYHHYSNVRKSILTWYYS